MRVLISVASRYGATAEIGQAVGAALEETGHDVTLVSAEEAPGPATFDAVIVGSGVYAGHWLEPAKRYVHDHASKLGQRLVWLFSSGPVGDPPKPDDDPVDVAALVEASGARGHRLFAGRIERTQLRFADRAIVAALRAPTGDFRDWDAIRAWGREVGAALDDGARG